MLLFVLHRFNFGSSNKDGANRINEDAFVQLFQSRLGVHAGTLNSVVEVIHYTCVFPAAAVSQCLLGNYPPRGVELVRVVGII